MDDQIIRLSRQRKPTEFESNWEFCTRFVSILDGSGISAWHNGWLVMKQVGINKYGGLIMKQRETIQRSVVMDYESERGGAEAS